MQGNIRMPVLFVGHGSPMNAIEDNRWSRGFAALGEGLARPQAILAVSAHWYVDGTWLTSASHPRTIHDFGGFPAALYEIDYPAPGAPELAERVRGLIGPVRASLTDTWGIDHGTWSVLRWMFPDADVPVVQLSIDRRLSARGHFELGQSIASLRDSGILILASGNVTHNLKDAFRRRGLGHDDSPDWARGFDGRVAQVLRERDTEALLALWPEHADSLRAHPTPDHWFPMLYAYGATDRRDAASFPVEGFDFGSLSMRSVVFA
jgi:4,5-DOPA dioxygenase extradiol